MADHRQEYPILNLYVAGSRMLDPYSQDDAIEDYLEMHPEARESVVRAELKRELKKIGFSEHLHTKYGDKEGT